MTVTEATRQLNEAYREKHEKDTVNLNKKVSLLTTQRDRALNKQSTVLNKKIKVLEKKVAKYNKLLLSSLNDRLSANVTIEEIMAILNR